MKNRLLPTALVLISAWGTIEGMAAILKDIEARKKATTETPAEPKPSGTSDQATQNLTQLAQSLKELATIAPKAPTGGAPRRGGPPPPPPAQPAPGPEVVGPMDAEAAKKTAEDMYVQAVATFNKEYDKKSELSISPAKNLELLQALTTSLEKYTQQPFRKTNIASRLKELAEWEYRLTIQGPLSPFNVRKMEAERIQKLNFKETLLAMLQKFYEGGAQPIAPAPAPKKPDIPIAKATVPEVPDTVAITLTGAIAIPAIPQGMPEEVIDGMREARYDIQRYFNAIKGKNLGKVRRQAMQEFKAAQATLDAIPHKNKDLVELGIIKSEKLITDYLEQLKEVLRTLAE